MNGKILINMDLTVLTGLHIGGSSTYSAIGAIDSPVIRNPINDEPIIPGSSLKGKMRTLLARKMYEGKGPYINKVEDDPIEIKRLFGSSDNNILPARLQFSDSYLDKDFVNEHPGRLLTEVKTENTINRANAVANPRQIERVIPSSKFNINIVYNIENPDEIDQDFDNIADALQLLQLDYLGGHGTRGSGRVSFTDIDLKPFETDVDLEPLKEKFKEVESNAILDL